MRYKQRDLETRAEERLRLDSLIVQREVERQQIAAQLQNLEQASDPTRRAKVVTPSPFVPPDMQPPDAALKPVKIFYSYSHKDEVLRDQLQKHLAILQRQGVISSWHDRSIQAGMEWERDINEHL